MVIVSFFKQKTAYEMRISDWSSDVCSSDLRCRPRVRSGHQHRDRCRCNTVAAADDDRDAGAAGAEFPVRHHPLRQHRTAGVVPGGPARTPGGIRSEEHTSELQSLMRISYAVFCLQKKNNINRNYTINPNT